MTHYKGIMFDLDGTLLNTLADLADCFNYALEQEGYPTHNTEAFRYFVGDGAVKAVTRALPEDARNKRALMTVLTRFREHYKDHFSDKSEPFPGMIELLKTLKAKGLKLGICSNKPQALTTQCGEHFFKGFFEPIIGQKESVPIKPDPAMLLAIANDWDLKPEEIIFVGDMPVDHKAAIGAGMKLILVDWGFCTREQLRRLEGATVISDPSEILDYL